jgi:predicted DsbA family dithiol-disulfide isomerase
MVTTALGRVMCSGPLAERVSEPYAPVVKKFLIDIWSDIVCPWCYIGKRRLEGALALFPHRADVEVRWHAFELDPSAPRVRDTSLSHAERLATKYGMSVTKAEAAIENLTQVAAADGLDFHFEKARSGNTFDAHRVLHLALERGVQDAVKERLLRGYMTEGASIGEPGTLAQLAAEAGLDGDEVRAMLASPRYAAEVRADEEQAARLGVSAVPFFVIGGRYAVSGAQSVQVLLGALDKAWADASVRPAEQVEGAVCGPDGCG